MLKCYTYNISNNFIDNTQQKTQKSHFMAMLQLNTLGMAKNQLDLFTHSCTITVHIKHMPLDHE